MSDDDEPRRELGTAIRYVHSVAARLREDHERLDGTVEALMAALIEAGVITDEAIDEHLADGSRQARARRPQQHEPLMDTCADKYAVPDPGIDCEARMHLCHGRCCSFAFALSAQDLDEGVVRWRYHEPYMNQQRADGYCVHNDATTRMCGVYQHRPGTCRSYDCRADRRVWIDFEARIPAPPEAVRAPLIEIKRRKPAP